MSELVITQTSLRILVERRVGTICLRQPCALCGRLFDIQNGSQVLIARDEEGEKIGEVCPRCAGSDEDSLKKRLAARAVRLREKAEEMERWSRGGIRTPAPEEPSAGDGHPESTHPQGSPRGYL